MKSNYAPVALVAIVLALGFYGVTRDHDRATAGGDTRQAAVAVTPDRAKADHPAPMPAEAPVAASTGLPEGQATDERSGANPVAQVDGQGPIESAWSDVKEGFREIGEATVDFFSGFGAHDRQAGQVSDAKSETQGHAGQPDARGARGLCG